MRFFRTFLLVLLFLALPVQGYAHIAGSSAPCQMEPMAMMDEADAVAMHDCCNDAETTSKTGKPCKSAQSCSASGQLLPFPEIGALPKNPASSTRYPPLADISFTFDPAATWRPPTQL